METPDEKYGERLKICNGADITELEDNIRCAMSILDSIPDTYITIRRHVLEYGVKNPEYIINGLIADRKGIMSEDGIAAAFNKALKQNCRAIVLDLDKRMSHRPLQTKKIARKIVYRTDFNPEQISCCYVVYRRKSVRISVKEKDLCTIESILDTIKAG
ncbi:MAG: hypothetical protein IJR34_02480 [Bacteroidales bacterium]|nr:hypothetical protein [Bacteroidales bacterium]